MSTPIRGMADIVQSVPTLIGYAPSAHVVVLGLNGTELIVTAAYECRDAQESDNGAGQVLTAAARQGTTSVIVLTYGLDQVTAARAMRDVRHHSAAHKLIVRETVRVAHGRMWVGRERGEGQAVPEAPEPGTTARLVEHGSPALSRAALAASWEPTGTLTPDESVTQREGAQLWAHLLAGDTLSEPEQRKALGMLATISGRDGVMTAFGLLGSADKWPDDLADTAATVQQELKGTPLSVPLEHLRHLVTACAPQHAAEVLAVAAVLAWTAGSGVVCTICAERARQAQPGHRLAGYVALAARSGLPAPTIH